MAIIPTKKESPPKKPEPLHIASSFKRFLDSKSRENRVAALLLDRNFTTSAEANYIAHRGDLISYLPNGKPHTTNPDGSWGREGRQEGKPARLVRKLIDEDFTDFFLKDKDFEEFANLVKVDAFYEGSQFQLVNGKDIAHWYTQATYAPRSGTLNGSCMRNVHTQYFDIYTTNPEVCQLLITRDKDGHLTGRALVWTHEDGTKLLDRIYGTDATQGLFKKYAQAQGWWARIQSGFSEHANFEDANGFERNLAAKIHLANATFNYYPYLDTMCFLDVTNRILSNSARTTYTHTLRSTGGNAERRR